MHLKKHCIMQSYPATNNVGWWAPDEGEQRFGGCAKTHLCRYSA